MTLLYIKKSKSDLSEIMQFFHSRKIQFNSIPYPTMTAIHVQQNDEKWLIEFVLRFNEFVETIYKNRL